MPNWCDTLLVVSGPEPTLSAFDRDAILVVLRPGGPIRLLRAFPSGTRVARDPLDHGRDPSMRTEPWTGADVLRTCVSVSTRRTRDQRHYEFATAWAPPLHWLARVAAQYPTLQFALWYHEPELSLTGHLAFADGHYVRANTPDGTRAECDDAIIAVLFGARDGYVSRSG